MAKKISNKAIHMTLQGVVLSYPYLNKKNMYDKYTLDVLMGEDHPHLKLLRQNILKVKIAHFGEDKTEWPADAKRKLVQDGNEREDQKPYKNKWFISPTSKDPIPAYNEHKQEISRVEGGLTANVAIVITKWVHKAKEGVGIYCNAVQVMTEVPKQSGFGGGRSLDEMFTFKKGSDKNSEEEELDEDDEPRSKKKAKSFHQPGKKVKINFDDDDDVKLPSKKKKKASNEEE